MRIKKDDTVLITRGKDRSKKSKVLRSFPKDSKVLVEGINIKKKHQKPKKEGEKGQVVDLPAPFSVANVKLICSKCNKPTRTGYKITAGKKYRICKKCNGEL